ncbi:MAG: TIGR03943 family protein [Microbacterium sp. 14-71-5]|uniref:TIGR03943 family putative permease subunit n=1 Tax=Microbacterium sp. 13-71-7 TaxID=1970399 RepID=UPI000BD41F21|nr:TIGR03943 family protein [Microbacterium sp. 13-71-7]OZB85818.1 MAG: TIGR03943 family protein [Microbacterium sp. 13-71-7]OZB88303.1 MAG: TIGR03943 family protein [Microbacterium sp. 14-71-5]
MPETTTAHRPSRAQALGTRWLGAGLAAALAIATLGLAFTGRLTLYISPETVWFAVAAAIATLVGAVWSCMLPLGAEQDHGHDHGDSGGDHDHDHAPVRSSRRVLGVVAGATGGVIATGVVAGALLLPPASLSVDMAMQRAPVGNVLFAGADNVALGANTDTSTFGVGGWASVFATGSRPEKYDGSTVTLTGFLTPSGSAKDQAHLTRMVITHCVLDAQPASVPVGISGWQGQYAVGDWVQVKGTVRASADGKLSIVPASVSKIPEPKDPYEH